MRVAQPQGSD
jgi:hypothetical protein